MRAGGGVIGGGWGAGGLSDEQETLSLTYVDTHH